MPLLCYYGPQLSEIVNLNKHFIFYVSLVIVCHQSYTTVTYIKVSNTECIIDSHSKSRVCVGGKGMLKTLGTWSRKASGCR